MITINTEEYIMQMLEDGFGIAYCKNKECSQMFSSGDYCSDCEEDVL